MKRVFVTIISKNTIEIRVKEKETGMIYSIPTQSLRGLLIKEAYLDDDSLPKMGMIYPAVIKEDNQTIYFDRFNTNYWNYSPQAQPAEEDDEWKLLLKRLLEKRLINMLSDGEIEELLCLYNKKQFAKFKQLISEKCQLYQYLMDEESDILESKSSLVHSARRSPAMSDEEDRATQFDELSQTLVAAANARNKQDFHLIVGRDDCGRFTNNVRVELDTYFNGSGKKFIDMFTNRLNQITETPEFTASLGFHFISLGSNLVLDITVPQWTGDAISCKGQFFLRVQSSTVHLKGEQLKRFIREYKSIH